MTDAAGKSIGRGACKDRLHFPAPKSIRLKANTGAAPDSASSLRFGNSVERVLVLPKSENA